MYYRYLIASPYCETVWSRVVIGHRILVTVTNYTIRFIITINVIAVLKCRVCVLLNSRLPFSGRLFSCIPFLLCHIQPCHFQSPRHLCRLKGYWCSKYALSPNTSNDDDVKLSQVINDSVTYFYRNDNYYNYYKEVNGNNWMNRPAAAAQKVVQKSITSHKSHKVDRKSGHTNLNFWSVSTPTVKTHMCGYATLHDWVPRWPRPTKPKMLKPPLLPAMQTIYSAVIKVFQVCYFSMWVCDYWTHRSSSQKNYNTFCTDLCVA